jgi:uncharacterized protein (TIGR02246 family)
MSSARLFFSTVALILSIACLAAAPAVADSSKQFANLSKDWEVAYNARDAARVAALYAEDGMVMPPNAAGAQGREAIEAYIKKDMAASPGKLEIKTDVHGSNGDLGFARGTYSVTDADGKVVDKGKWVEVRKKINGKWYISSDIWNSDMSLGGN